MEGRDELTSNPVELIEEALPAAFNQAHPTGYKE